MLRFCAQFVRILLCFLDFILWKGVRSWLWLWRLKTQLDHLMVKWNCGVSITPHRLLGIIAGGKTEFPHNRSELFVFFFYCKRRVGIRLCNGVCVCVCFGSAYHIINTTRQPDIWCKCQKRKYFGDKTNLPKTVLHQSFYTSWTDTFFSYLLISIIFWNFI